MNSREIVLKALNLEETPRLPVALLSGGVWTFNRRGLSLEEVLGNPKLSAEVIAESNEEVKSDIVWAGSGYHNLVIKSFGGKIKFRKNGAPDVQEALLKYVSDIDKLRIENLFEDEETNSLWETTKILHKNIGASTLIGASQWGPFTLAGAFYGVERIMRSIYKDEAAARSVLNLTSEIVYQYLLSFVKAGAEIISIADPTASGDLISRRQFEKFSLPYLKEVTKKLQDNGAKVLIHICGNITNRLDLILKTGADVISVDYKVDLTKVRETVGAKMAFAGNMNPVAVMKSASTEEVKTECVKCIEKSGNPGFILMPGCDIPHNVPFENIKAMVDIAHNTILV